MTDPNFPPPASQPTPPPLPTAQPTATPAGAYPPGAPAPIASEPAPPPAASKQGNIPGLIAFIISVVGFVFACIPGALIVGWVLLPVAFILAIVALVLPQRKRAFALSALIIAVVGTIVGIVVFVAVVASSVSNAFGGGDPIVKGTPKASSSASAGATLGSRKNPVAIGATITGKEYTVVINSVTLNANEQVAAANEFNDAPPAGYTYAVVNATITYNGDDSGTVGVVSLDYVTSAGNVVDKLSYNAVAPEPALQLQEIYKGASVTGNEVIAIPDGDDGLLRVRPGLLASEVFVSIK